MADQTTAAAAPAASDDVRPFRYNAALADQIESRWQTYWDQHDSFAALNPGDVGFDPAQPKFFCMDMFPYPSGAGLHVGHPLGYIATDIICRYKRMTGANVLHPMGWDAFGLPAEQYAIKTGVHPAKTTRTAIETFRRQLKRFGFSYDWKREFATIDDDYVKWTQWIWLQAYTSWYDPRAEKARPILDLIGELEGGAVTVSDEHELLFDGSGTLWDSIDAREQRDIIDDQRLAYLAEQTVNWCPKLGTVLANEEVIDGRSERGGFPVYRRPLKQWMFRITAYADRLLKDLEPLKWPESTKTQQGVWIGRSEGAEIDFPLADAVEGYERIRVYTTRPDTLFGATYMVLAPEHPMVEQMLAAPTDATDVDAVRAYVEESKNRADVDRMADAKEKTGAFTGFHATNPATGERIPIWVADYVLMGYGHGAIMAVPAHDQRDFDFAKTFDLTIRAVVMPDDEWLKEHAIDADSYAANPGQLDVAASGNGKAINSTNDGVSLDGLAVRGAKKTITRWLEDTKQGKGAVNFKLRDWLFSRQRYWGEPFPIVYDEHGDHYGLDESALPLTLPELEDYEPAESDDPQPLLGKATGWVKTTAGEAGVTSLPPDTPVTRETNTMPGWAGSCWYYLRYMDPHNDGRFASRDAEHYWMLSPKSGAPADAPRDHYDADVHHTGGVDLYIGGAEHATLHLLYARFWHKMLFDLGHVSTPEPFGKLFHQGLLTAYAYQRPDKSLVPVDEVEQPNEDEFIETATGEPVARVITKMSKSLKNVINPDDIIAEYGADTFRLYEMYMGPLEASKPWNTRDIVGPHRFLQRLWRLAVNEEDGSLVVRTDRDDDVEKQLHRTIAKVGEDIERLAFNTGIAALIEFVNAATGSGGVTKDQLERLTLIAAPFVPHLAEELWSKLGHGESLIRQPWPTYDESMLTDSEIELPVQIQGKVRGRVTVPADADPKTVEDLALADEKIAAQLEGKTVRKVIVVPGKIVNIIAG